MDRSLKILSGLALPMALLLIGASLSFKLMQLKIFQLFSSSFLKLILLPGLGVIFYRLFHIDPQGYLPGLILLASPTATLTYIMAKEMNGDEDFAVAAVSVCTMLSAVTFFHMAALSQAGIILACTKNCLFPPYLPTQI